MPTCQGNSGCNTDTAASFNFTARKGTTFSYKMSFKVYPTDGSPADAVPEDISDSLFYMQVRTYTGSLILDLTEQNGRLSKLDNTLTIYVAADVMGTIPPGNFQYDLMQEDIVSGNVIARLAGSFTVNQNITQIPSNELAHSYRTVM